MAIECFNETSLGEPSTLVAIATRTLSHPRLQQEFWDEVCCVISEGSVSSDAVLVCVCSVMVVEEWACCCLLP